MGKEINRTVSLALACAGLGLGVATWVARGEADRNQLEVTGDRLRSLREMHARHLGGACQTLLDSTAALAAESSVRELIESEPSALALVEAERNRTVQSVTSAARSLGTESAAIVTASGAILTGVERHGPRATSALGAAVAQIISGERQSPLMTDFVSYAPADGAPRAFIVASVFADTQPTADVGDQPTESPAVDVLGFVALELATDRFNRLLTGEGRWREEGLGASGEVYLVGQDLRMRTESRFLQEDRQGYASALLKSGANEAQVAEILEAGSSILLQQVDSEGARLALDGESNTRIIDDYRGVRVLSSYMPLDLGGTRFALMSEMDTEEVSRASRRIAVDILLPALMTLFGVGLVSYLIGIRRTRRWSALRHRVSDLAAAAGAETPPESSVDDEVSAIRGSISHLEGVVTDIRQRSQFLRAVFDADPAAVFVCAYPQAATRQGRDDPRLLDASASAMELIGLGPGELHRAALSDVLRGTASDDDPHGLCWLDDLRDEGALEKVPVQLINGARERIRAELDATVCTEGPENEWFLVLVARFDDDPTEAELPGSSPDVTA